MTKEELIQLNDEGNLTQQELEDFFESNVCILKGENRVKFADEFHLMLEGIETEMQLDGFIPWIKCNIKNVRIKPSEPIYEWQYCHDNCGGKNIVADKYYTDYEYETMVDDKERCIKLPWTKKERT